MPSVCVCPLIDHGQQPIKMHTESRYCINSTSDIVNTETKRKCIVRQDSLFSTTYVLHYTEN